MKKLGHIHFRNLLVGIIFLASMIAIWVGGGTPAAQAAANQNFIVKQVTTANGAHLEEVIINSPSTPPKGIERAAVSLPKSNPEVGVITLAVPAYEWTFGCSATSGSMIAAYYDRNGFPNIYTGPTNSGVMPMDSSVWPNWTDGTGTEYAQCPLAASHYGLDGRTTRGSIDDYWVGVSGAADPYMTGGWAQHAWGDSIGDYMKTSQYAYYNDDGSTTFYINSSSTPLTCAEMGSDGIGVYDGNYGRALFYQARGYTVTDCYTQLTDDYISGGFSFAQYKAEIDAGHPVMLQLAGHTIVGIGYDNSTSPATVYLHDTWDYLTHTMPWGGSYAGMQLWGASIVNLQPVPGISGNVGVGGAVLSYTDGTSKTAVSDGSGNYSFTVSSGWSGTVTPSKACFTFNSTYLTYTNVTSSQTGQNYTATNLPGCALPAVFRPSNGTWYINGVGATQYGTNGDIPVPADYTGAGKTELAVFRPSNGKWYINGVGVTQYGTNGDIPVPADYTGVGHAQLAVFRPSNGKWYINGVGVTQYGTNGDIPVPADYTGVGHAQLAVFRPSNGTWYIYGVGSFAYGHYRDIPVPADYNGDGKAELAVFRPNNGIWYIKGVGSFVNGQNSDIPIPADYNGDGNIELAVFRPSNGTWYIKGVGAFAYGTNGDIPVPSYYGGK